MLCFTPFPKQLPQRCWRGEVLGGGKTKQNKKHTARRRRKLILATGNTRAFVRLIRLRRARPRLIKVFRSEESHAGPERADAPLFFPSITSTVITFVYSGGNGSCLIRSYWGDNSQVILKRRSASFSPGCRWIISCVWRGVAWGHDGEEDAPGEWPTQITAGLSDLEPCFLRGFFFFFFFFFFSLLSFSPWRW